MRNVILSIKSYLFQAYHLSFDFKHFIKDSLIAINYAANSSILYGCIAFLMSFVLMVSTEISTHISLSWTFKDSEGSVSWLLLLCTYDWSPTRINESKPFLDCLFSTFYPCLFYPCSLILLVLPKYQTL